MALGAAVDLMLADPETRAETAFGWVAFEFGAFKFGLEDRLPPKTPLARVFSPRTHIEVTAEQVTVLGAVATATWRSCGG